MSRKKVKLSFISNDSSRKATFKKRKKGLIKKMNELSTLCGINASAIIYSPYDSNPEVWPSTSGVQRVISEFKMLSEMDQHKKMVDQETYLRQRITKTSEHLRRQRKENRELEMTEVMFQCLAGNIGMFHLNNLDLNDLGYLIDQYLNYVNHKIEILRNSGMEIEESSNADVAVTGGIGTMTVRTSTSAPTTTLIELGSSSSFAAASTLFNPIQQHHNQYQQHQHQSRHLATPHVGFYEQSHIQNENHNQNHQQWFTEMTSHPEQMNYVEYMGFPFMDGNQHNPNHHHPHQEHILGESSNIIGSASTSNNIPITSPNLTNNLWFR